MNNGKRAAKAATESNFLRHKGNSRSSRKTKKWAKRYWWKIIRLEFKDELKKNVKEDD